MQIKSYRRSLSLRPNVIKNSKWNIRVKYLHLMAYLFFSFSLLFFCAFKLQQPDVHDFFPSLAIDKRWVLPTVDRVMEKKRVYKRKCMQTNLFHSFELFDLLLFDFYFFPSVCSVKIAWIFLRKVQQEKSLNCRCVWFTQLHFCLLFPTKASTDYRHQTDA